MAGSSGLRSLAVALGALFVVVACGPGSSGGEQLAADQTLNFPLNDDVGDLDPANLSAAVDIDIFRNVFSGLYKFDDQLNEVPDIASGPPKISPDGLTYTFSMRHDAKFSNGDPIKSDDFIYSWDRAARLQGDYASVFDPVVGYSDVAAPQSTVKHMKGLNKIDDYTFSATLSAPAGYWFIEVALWTAWVVDKKVIDVAGDDKWYTDPKTFIGSGPFKMTARTPKQSLDFASVPNWYGGSTGSLTKIHIEVVADQKAQVTKYESGGYGLIGFGDQRMTPEDTLRYQADPKLKKELLIVPGARTTWIGFNMCTGVGQPYKDCKGPSPFGGDAGKLGRHAFSIAIDRDQLVDVACSKGITCAKATGGVIPKGLRGYLGDNTDPTAVFDAAKAKTEYKQWDPDGTKVKGLTYYYNTNGFNKAVCENLASQWQKNLSITVQCSVQDRASFFNTRKKCTYQIFRHSWSADYDNPQNWFDFLFVTGGGTNGQCYSNSKLDQMAKDANSKPIAQSLDTYKKMNQMLIDDVATGNLVYTILTYTIHPWVKGAGGNTLSDYYWTGVKILQH